MPSERNAHRRLTVNPDGRRLHLSDMGAGAGLVLQESSESEEELPPPTPAPGAAFAKILEEVKTGAQNANSTPSSNQQLSAVNSNRSRQEPVAISSTHNWLIPELHPNETEAGRIREAEVSIKRVREGYLRTTVPICEMQHKVLVCQWSFSDPTNRKGTWSLEVVDFRRTLWLNDVGIEEHKQCSVGGMPELLDKLARAMTDHWKNTAPNHIAYEPDCHKRQHLKEQLDSRLQPSITKIEHELGSLIVYVMGNITKDSAEGTVGEKGDKGEKNEKGGRYENSQKLDKESLKIKKEAARKKAELALLRGTMEVQGERRAWNANRVEETLALKAEAQREYNGAQVSTTKTQKAAPRKATKLELADEDRELSKSIRAAEQEDRKRQEQEEREVEERQQELFAQQDEVDVTASREESPDDGMGAAILDALDNAVSKAEAPKEKPAKKVQKAAEGSKSTARNAIDDSERKRRVKPRAHVPTIVQDSSGSDSVKPPQKPSETTKSKPKTKPTIRKPTVSFADHLTAKKADLDGESEAKEHNQTDELSGISNASEKPETKKTKTVKKKTNKTRKSEEYVADSDLEEDTAGDVKLPSDKLQSESMSVETTETASMNTSTKQNGNVVEEAVEITTVVVKVQHDDSSIERTEVTETTAVSSNLSEQGEATVEHSIHTHITATLDVPAPNLPHNSPPPSPEQERQDGLNTPTNTLGIDVTISSPPPSPAPPVASLHRKRKQSPTTEKPDPEYQTQPSTTASPSSPKKRKTTASPHTPDAPSAPHTSSTPPTPPAASAETARSSKERNTSLHTSPAISLPASPFSSGLKRKGPLTDEDGVARSAGGKRVKREQGTDGSFGEGLEQGSRVDGGGEIEGGMQTRVDVVVAGLEDVWDVEREDDQASYDSLFD